MYTLEINTIDVLFVRRWIEADGPPLRGGVIVYYYIILHCILVHCILFYIVLYY